LPRYSWLAIPTRSGNFQALAAQAREEWNLIDKERFEIAWVVISMYEYNAEDKRSTSRIIHFRLIFFFVKQGGPRRCKTRIP